MTFRVDWAVQPHQTPPGTVGTVSVSGVVFTGSEEQHPHGDWKAVANAVTSYPIELGNILPPDTSILNAWYDIKQGFRDLNNMKTMRISEGDPGIVYVTVESLNQDIDTELEIIIHILFRVNDGPPPIPSK